MTRYQETNAAEKAKEIIMTIYTQATKSAQDIFKNGADIYLDRFFSDTPFWQQRNPVVDIVEQPDSYLLKAELAGYSDDQIDIQIIEGRLQLKAAREKEEGRFLLKERNNNELTRSFALPKDADKQNIKAAFNNGLLTLTIPRKKPESRKINIEL